MLQEKNKNNWYKAISYVFQLVFKCHKNVLQNFY